MRRFSGTSLSASSSFVFTDDEEKIKSREKNGNARVYCKEKMEMFSVSTILQNKQH